MPRFCGARALQGRTRRWKRLVAAGCFLFGCVASALWAQKQDRAPEKAGLVRRDRFEGSTTLHTKGGTTAHVDVTVHQWSIGGKQRIEIPEHGFLVAQLRAGSITTTIDGKQEKRRAGDFWTVSANSRMSVQVTSEAAVLEVTSLSLP